jgi:EpsI family protein
LYNLWITSNDTTYSHGSILFLISIYYVYSRWRSVKDHISLSPSLFGLFLLFLTSLAWYLSKIANIQVVQKLLFIFQFIFLFWALMGYKIARVFAFPILLLVCAVPIWEVINEGWLQQATAAGVSFLLEIIGIVTYREGNLIFVPAGTFEVAENCSGMRQLVVAIPIALLYANLNRFRIAPTLVYVFIAIVLSFLINTLRIFIVVVAGQLTNMQHYFIREDHVTLGWVLFGIAMFLFIIISNRILMTSKNNRPDKNIARNYINLQCNPLTKGRQLTISTLAMIFLALTTGPVLAFLKSSESLPRMDNLVIPSEINEWRFRSHIVDVYQYKPDFRTADIISNGYYINNSGEVVYTYIGYYWKQEQGKELISSLNSMYNKSVWHAVKTIRRDINIQNKRFGINEIVLQSNSGQKILVWNWYYLAGTRTNNHVIAKLLGIWKELTNQKGAAVFIIASKVTNSPESSRKILKQFLNQSLDPLENSIDEVVVSRDIIK